MKAKTLQFFEGKLRLPVIAAPMFLVSGPKLVTESCKAGVVGTFPALNQRSTDGFSEWVDEIQSELKSHPLAAPFGVNLIVHGSNPRVKADLMVCVKKKIPLVITSLGAVKDVVDAVHSYGGLVFHDVTNLRHAKKAAEAGVDGIIAVSAGAGGHAGAINPFTLFQEIRSFYNGIIVLAGAISNGEQIATAEFLGADFAYMGTRFINTTESLAPEKYKQMVIQSEASQIVYTPAISGIPANFMAASLTENGIDLKNPEQKSHAKLGEELTMQDEAKAWKTVWSAGHGVSQIQDVLPVAQLVDRLEKEYRETWTTRKSRFLV